MSVPVKETADYMILSGTESNRYRFYCGVSGAAVCTTGPVRADTGEDELRIAWENEGKRHFNFCRKCGRWVCDAMYNPDVLACVDCTPLEAAPLYCKHCGEKVPGTDFFCRKCGFKLKYGGEECDDC